MDPNLPASAKGLSLADMSLVVYFVWSQSIGDTRANKATLILILFPWDT